MLPEDLVQRRDVLQKLVGKFPIVVIETFQNWGETQTMKVLSVKPKTVDEVVSVVKAATKSLKEKFSIRCVGDAHSWSPLFPDEGNILMHMKDLMPSSGQRITLNKPVKDSDDTTVTIAPGVTTGELSDFFTKNNVCLMSDVILDKVTYGGVIATGCHGVGKDQKSVSDVVMGMSLVNDNGDTKTYDFKKTTFGSQNFYNSLKCNLGLFGVMTDITLKVEPMVIVETVNDFSLTVEDVFYNPGKLKKLYEDNWSLEIFWFPFNSLSWLEALSIPIGLPVSLFWTARHDKLWIRKINVVDVPNGPCPSDSDYSYKGAKDLVSTTFGRIFSGNLNEHQRLVPSFLKAGFEMVRRFNKHPTFEYINKAIHYQNFIEVFPVVDMEFAFNVDKSFVDQARAMQVVVEKCESFATHSKFPLSVAMEMRWIASSDVLLCPARAASSIDQGGSGKTLYLEVLGIAGQPDKNWENFTTEVADEWLKIAPGDRKPVPHWAKQWSYIPGIIPAIQEVHGKSLKIFKRALIDASNNYSVFSNETLNKVIFEDHATEAQGSKLRCLRKRPATKQQRAKSKRSKADAETIMNLSNLPEYGKEHEKSWEEFWISMGEQVWTVPNASPRTNIDREWHMAFGIIEELKLKMRKGDPLVDKYMMPFVMA